ncbi:MAG TPA: hypothetical protein VFD37_05325 [Solirubrobacterales bacterium]|nr:hypothetical protein [Solirubrobacterales bacterium]
MTVGEITPGYEVWRPNREKAETNATKALVTLLLLASGVLTTIITIGGFTVLQGGAFMGIICIIFALIYVLFAVLAARWSRGVLPVAASAAVFMAIFAGVAVPSWFGRDKAGFEETLLPAPLLGLLTAALLILQLVVVVVAVIAFNQDWHVEEERPIGSGTEYGAGSEHQPPSSAPPQPA